MTIFTLWWLLFGLATFIYVTVMVMTLYAVFRLRQDKALNSLFSGNGRSLLTHSGILIAAIILTLIYGFTLSTLAKIDLPQTADNHPTTEVHIPVGQPHTLQLNAATANHRIAPPEPYNTPHLIPGRTLWPPAPEPGQYWHLCTEPCGIHQANMLLIVAQQPATHISGEDLPTLLVYLETLP